MHIDKMSQFLDQFGMVIKLIHAFDKWRNQMQSFQVHRYHIIIENMNSFFFFTYV